MKPVIAVCGSDAPHIRGSDTALIVAEEVGREIARRGAVVVCGGRGGVMEAACRGAKQQNGLTIGVLPGESDQGNAFLDLRIPTRLGHMRNYLVVNSGEVVIAIGGRWGTLNELSYAMILGKPVVLVRGTGGIVDFVITSDLLKKFEGKAHVASSAVEAVDCAFGYCKR